MPQRSLVLPPGHRLTVTIDGDKPLGVTVVAYRGDQWLGEASIDQIDDVEGLQEIVDMLTKRGPRLKK